MSGWNSLSEIRKPRNQGAGGKMDYRAHSTGTVILNWAFYLKGIGGLAVEKSRREFRNLTWRKSQRGDGRMFSRFLWRVCLKTGGRGLLRSPRPPVTGRAVSFYLRPALKAGFAILMMFRWFSPRSVLPEQGGRGAGPPK